MVPKIVKVFGNNLMSWFSTVPSLIPVRNILDALIALYYRKGKNVRLTLTYADNSRKDVINKIESICKQTSMLMHLDEAYRIFMAVKNTQKVKGNIAEFGVYSGGSAKVICEAKGDKTLHLFDTFEELPNPNDLYSKKHTRHMWDSLPFVKGLLKDYKNVFFYRGFFPDTAKPLKDVRFSFVHLDVDEYSSTSSGLEFFYPRMNKCGIIISHDYITTKGVRKAFDDFFKDKAEPIIELSESQCMIVRN